MKKLLKKVVSMGMAAMVLCAGIAAQPKLVAEAKDEYTAFLMFSDTEWMFGNWDASLESATTKVTGAGSYSVTLLASELVGDEELSANGTMLLGVDIIGANDGFAALGKTLNLTALSVKADGKEIDVDMSKVLTGDTEGNGDYYIEIFNEYGNTFYNPPIDNESLTFTESITIDFTLEEISQPVAYLVFADKDGNFANSNAALASATEPFHGEGFYSVGLDATEVGGDGNTPANGVDILCVDILEAQAELADGHSYEVTDVEIWADGVQVPVDLEKVKYGDLEGNGNFRLELYNANGETANAPAFDFSALSYASYLEVNFSLELKVEGKPEVTETPSENNGASLNSNSNADTNTNSDANTNTENATASDDKNADESVSEEKSGSSSTGAIVSIICGVAALVLAGAVVTQKKFKKEK